MRVAILSDIHANTEALRAALEAIAAEPPDRILCLGDIVGHNTEPCECVALLRATGALCIAGNHDRAAIGQISTQGFSSTAARAIDWTRERISGDARTYIGSLPLKLVIGDQLVAVHGALHVDEGCELVRLNTDERRRLSFEALAAHPSGARICAYGHTHQVGVHEMRDGRISCLAGDEIHLRDDAYYLVNPGTIGEPRSEEQRATFIVLDTERRLVTIRRVAYDRRAVLRKTRKAGLGKAPLPLGLRTILRRGRRILGI